MMKNFTKKVIRFVLIRLIYPLYYLLYETFFYSKCTIVSASVKPFRYNWGDNMSIILCQLVNPRRKFIVRRYTWNVFRRDDILCIGSIITWMTTPRSVIWGSGIMYPEREITAIPKKVLAVRGPLTRNYLLQRGIDCPEVYGDPALLLPRFYQPIVKKKYKLGIIPHFRDKGNPILEKFISDASVLIVDVEDVHPWTKFIDDICSCEYIATSSLHGMIISDAYGVPNIWAEFVGGERKVFAFRDYLESVDRNEESAFSFSEEVTVQKVVEQVRKWHPIQIDLDKLVAVCPFKINRYD